MSDTPEIGRTGRPVGWDLALVLLTAGTLAALTAMQYTGTGFGLSLRYHVALLPQVAILATHAFSSPDRTTWLGAAALGVAVLLLLSPFSWLPPPE